ncbi:acyltransferase family protein [Streptomyces olivaceoviridis]|uniref:acyltransferase family protein n=1 Tax=Streptomyces olivaceoviridis TaxID=1921 RepID=UPI0036A2CAD8
MTHLATFFSFRRGSAPHSSPEEVRHCPRKAAASPTGASGTAFRADIQGLRGLAVVLVVLGHAQVPYLAGGYVGVDVFFVISGFVITCGLLREARRSGTLRLRRFYARRAARLLPLATLVGMVTLVGCRLFASKIRYEEFLHDALASALYFMNVDLAAAGADYLQEGATPSPFQHMWSLSVEEQFYVLWPVLLLGTFTLLRRPWLRMLPLVLLCLVSFAWSVQAVDTSSPWAYFGLHTRLWELGAGGLLAFCTGALSRLPRAMGAVAGWLGLLAIVAAAVLYGDATPFPGRLALLPVLGAALVIAGGLVPSPYGAARLLRARPATWVGDVSYGWYLWHWPLLMLGPAALNRTATPQLALVLSGIAMVLAWLSLHLVENPLRHHRALRHRPRAALSLGLGLSGTVVCTALIAGCFPPAISTGDRARDLASMLATAPDAQARLSQLLAAPAAGLPSNLTPPLTEVKRQRSAVYRDGCHVNYDAAQSPQCVYGDRSSDKVVVLFGDSHAAQWFPAWEKLSHDYGWKLVSLTKSSCKTADITIVVQNRPYTSCDSWKEKALKRIEQLHPVLVVTSSSEAAKPAHRMEDPQREWTAGYERVYRRLAHAADRLIVTLDNPWPRGDAVECAARNPVHLRRCEPDGSAAIKSPILRRAGRTAALHADATVVDPQPWLCPPRGKCPSVVADTFVYRDESHMAESYVEALTPVLRQRVERLGISGTAIR